MKLCNIPFTVALQHVLFGTLPSLSTAAALLLLLAVR